MNKELNDKLVLITGASSGIGKGLAKRLCRNGYNLILTSRSNEKLSQLKDELSDFSEKIHLIACDLTNSDDVENLYKKTVEIGFVECIVSNAGLGRFSSIDKMSVDDWDIQINTNLRPSFLLARLCITTVCSR